MCMCACVRVRASVRACERACVRLKKILNFYSAVDVFCCCYCLFWVFVCFVLLLLCFFVFS